ncbi:MULTISPECIES: hypothetical protein [Halostella]|uniref:hypothetical protein n=1 Tax=Halostella TaxID=1843185 RepID=UPI001878F6A9|nr:MULTISPECIES: hypothetical protein [Halostella]
MVLSPTPRAVALGAGAVGTVGVTIAADILSNVPETPRGDGFAAGLAGIFAVVYAVAGSLAIAEAGLLYLVARTSAPEERPRQLLTLGVAAGGGAVLLLAVQYVLTTLWTLTGTHLFVRIDGPIGLGLALVPVGVVCSGLGAALQVSDTLGVGSRA